MAWYNVVIVSDRGSKIRETIESDDGSVLKEALTRQYPKAKKIAVNKVLEIPGMAVKVLIKDVVIFTRQFATMIDAGLPLVQCLEILAKQQPNLTLRSAISKIKKKVEGGSTFAEALGEHPKIFDNLYVNLVAAGEVGGILDNILNRLATHMEKAEKLKKTIKSAMIYPAITTAVATSVTLVLLLFVIPIFQKMFSDFGGELPGLTQKVVNMSDFTRQYWYMIVLIIVGGGFVFKTITATEKGEYAWHGILMKFPAIGDVVVKGAVATFTRTLSTMLTSGVPILDALEICAKTSGNKVIEKAIFESRDAISEGRTLTDPLKESQVFPSMVIQMIEVGEQTGALDSMLAKIADFYDNEVEESVETMTALIEPIMIVVLGGILGTLVIAMYLPIFAMAGAVEG
jgi:type IV pilus assembly protein PilC